LLIEKLDFQLVIHTAYRPFEGLIIDLKVEEKNHRFALLFVFVFRHIIYVIMSIKPTNYD